MTISENYIYDNQTEEGFILEDNGLINVFGVAYDKEKIDFLILSNSKENDIDILNRKVVLANDMYSVIKLEDKKIPYIKH